MANPIAADQQLMRRSLLPAVLRNIRQNAKYFDSFRFFEIGHEIHPRNGELPEEIPHAMAVFFTRATDASELLELKRVAECLVSRAVVGPAEARPYEHPARTGDVILGGSVIGRLFEIHPSLVEGGRAGVLDLDLRAVHADWDEERRYVPLRRFPTSAFDLSVVAGLRDLAGNLQQKLVENAGPLLVGIEFLVSTAVPHCPTIGKASPTGSLSVHRTVLSLPTT